MKNPKEGLVALVDPAPITLGQIALLDLYGSPLLKGEIGDLNACIFSLWLLSMPLDLAVQEAHFPDKAIVWAETLDAETYNRRLTAALDGIAAFFHILPRPENGDGLKKNGRARRQRRHPRARGSTLPRLRLDAPPRARGDPGGPGGARLPRLCAGSGRPEDRNAARGRAGVRALGQEGIANGDELRLEVGG